MVLMVVLYVRAAVQGIVVLPAGVAVVGFLRTRRVPRQDIAEVELALSTVDRQNRTAVAVDETTRRSSVSGCEAGALPSEACGGEPLLTRDPLSTPPSGASRLSTSTARIVARYTPRLGVHRIGRLWRWDVFEEALPWLDEHTSVIAADPGGVWDAVAEVVARSFSHASFARYARVVGAVPLSTAGRWPYGEGSSVPGFRVETAVPERELGLAGRHRFSEYSLVFRVEPVGPGRTRLRAESRAAFPGRSGRGYRLLVVGTGAHAVGMRRLLAAIRRRAEV